MSWKQIKIFTADAEQSVIIESNPEKDGMVMYSVEEHEKESFVLYKQGDFRNLEEKVKQK